MNNIKIKNRTVCMNKSTKYEKRQLRQRRLDVKQKYCYMYFK